LKCSAAEGANIHSSGAAQPGTGRLFFRGYIFTAIEHKCKAHKKDLARFGEFD